MKVSIKNSVKKVVKTSMKSAVKSSLNKIKADNSASLFLAQQIKNLDSMEKFKDFKPMNVIQDLGSMEKFKDFKPMNVTQDLGSMEKFKDFKPMNVTQDLGSMEKFKDFKPMNVIQDLGSMEKFKDFKPMNVIQDLGSMEKFKDFKPMNVIQDLGSMEKFKDFKPMNVTQDLGSMEKFKDFKPMNVTQSFVPMDRSVDSILANQPDISIYFGNLRVSPYELESLLDVKIEQKVNEHGTFYFKGLLSDEKKDIYADVSAEGVNVVLSVMEETGDESIVFQGIVHDVEIKVMEELYYIEVYAVSYSYLLDVGKKSRSFQDKKMTYEQIANQVSAAYPGAGVLDVISDDDPTGKFIMQHMETDWEFLKRLASHFHTGMVCDIRFDRPINYIGVPQIQSLELEYYDYSVKKDMKKYKQLSENGVPELYENDFIFYEVATDKVVHIGDEVQFQNKRLYIAQIISVVDRGIFVSYCTLTTKNGLSQLYQHHEKIVGGSFNGHILEIKNDRVKIALDTDQGHDPGKPCFFPYSTIYSSQDGSGWYCMPEIGDSVRLYFPDGEEEHAYVISSVHEQVNLPEEQGQEKGGSGGEGEYSGRRDDPNVKSLRNVSGKEIRLTPKGIYIISDGATITLKEDDGIVIMSENNIEFKSDKNIIMNAGQEVQIIGTAEVGLCSESATITMKEKVEIVGQEVKAN